MTYDVTEVHAYYRAALTALAYLERARPSGRRFGPEADARWTALAGGLGIADRIDLLLRDADAEWPGSLGARVVFALPHVAEDDAFGRDWPGLEPTVAPRFFDDAAASSPSDVPGALRAMALAWGITLIDQAPPVVDPRARYVVAGASAITSLAVAFADTAEASWSRQVVAVCEGPVARQLAAAIPALLNESGSAAMLSPRDPLPPSFARAHVVVSSDATPAESASASRAAPV